MNDPMISQIPMMMNQIPSRVASTLTDEAGVAVTTIPAARLTTPKKIHQAAQETNAAGVRLITCAG
jgi:hypothetical protein